MTERTYFVASPADASEAQFLIGQWLGTYGVEGDDHGKKFQVNIEVAEIT